ncbi:hypothetical protein [Nocardioides sp.]|uniref:hypothetical protein n=1 Tax=Nocardioides sp. TaxID=35761 RepID=UPI003527AD27
MFDRRDRVCVPMEVEMIPLYREPAWSVRLRRQQRRERRRSWRLAVARRGRALLRRT